MNKSKVIILVVAVAVTVAVGVIIAVSGLGEQKKIQLPENQFIAKIEQAIKQLKAKPNNKFCKDFYKEISAEINSFYGQKKFGEKIDASGKRTYDTLANDLRKENFEKTLYATYTDKFINQAFYVFQRSEWKPEDLKFIQLEKNELKKSKLLVAESPVDKKFDTIQTALNKYNEVVGFIAQCKNFDYSDTSLSARFPISDVQSKISRAATLRNNNLENGYVNNCTRLHEELKNVPQTLFCAHVRYLDKKIRYWSGSRMYPNFVSHSDYVNNLHGPLCGEIETLKEDDYNVANFDSEYNRLYDKWSAEKTNAFKPPY